MEDQREDRPLTAEDVRKEVKATMMEQHTRILEMANRNALKIYQDERKKSAPALLETISGEVQASKSHDSHVWNTPINKSNFDILQQVEQLWARSERYVEVLDVSNDQAVFKQGAIDMMKKGKSLIHERIKLIKYADREGWKAALYYEGDKIAETEAEEKRMRKSKKETEKEKDAEKSRKEATRRFFERKAEQGSSRDSRSERDRRSTSRTSSRITEQVFCYKCKRYGHRTNAWSCPNRR